MSSKVGRVSSVELSSFCKPSGAERSILLKNCIVIDPKTRTKIQNGYVLTKNNTIQDFGKMTDLNGFDESSVFDVIDCAGRAVCPGLIDIQVHFRDPGFFAKEDLVTGSMSAVSGGITTVVCQPNTKPTIDSTFVLDYLKYKSLTESYCDIKVYASVTKGLLGTEISDIASLALHELVVGFTDDGLPVRNSHIMRLALELSREGGFVVAQHAEDLEISNRGCINEGVVSAKLGVRGINNSSESTIVARDIEILRCVGGRYHVLHVSAKESVELIRRAKNDGLNITAEVSPHHLFLTEDCVLTHGTNAKMNPPLRTEIDKIALQNALKEGVIDAIATDHAPHDKASKEKGIEEATFGIIGLETMLASSLSLYNSGFMDIFDVLGSMTFKAAKIVNLTDRGEIKKGYKADLAIIDLENEWVFSESDIVSRSSNTPFLGQKFKGKVDFTIYNGSVVYKR